MAFARTWNAAYENSPLDSDLASTLGSQVRNLKTDIEQRLSVDHIMYPNPGYIAGDDGKHAQVTWKAGLAAPGTPAVAGDIVSYFDAGGALSTKDSNGFITHLGAEPSSLGDANQTLTAASGRVIGTTPSTVRTWTLPTTSVKSGMPITVFNFGVQGTGIIVVQGSDGSVCATIDGGSSATFYALINTPVTGANWKVVHEQGAVADLKASMLFNPAPGWVACAGQALSRTTYAALFAAISISTTGNTHGTQIIDNIPNTTGMDVGMPISGVNIPAATTILSVDGLNQIHISQNASGSSVGGALVVAPAGIGDGATTFNAPDMRGRAPIGAGTGTATGATKHVLGIKGGEETHQLVTAELASHTHTVDWWQSAGVAGANPSITLPAVTDTTVPTTPTNNGAVYTDAAGSGTPHNNMEPFQVASYFIHV